MLIRTALIGALIDIVPHVRHPARPCGFFFCGPGGAKNRRSIVDLVRSRALRSLAVGLPGFTRDWGRAWCVLWRICAAVPVPRPRVRCRPARPRVAGAGAAAHRAVFPTPQARTRITHHGSTDHAPPYSITAASARLESRLATPGSDQRPPPRGIKPDKWASSFYLELSHSA